MIRMPKFLVKEAFVPRASLHYKLIACEGGLIHNSPSSLVFSSSIQPRHQSSATLHFIFHVNMATMIRALSFAVMFLMVCSIFFFESTEARPFSILESRNSAASRAIGSFFDGLSLAQIKQSGPSPGVGHGYTTGTHQ
ncbi:hypothetical protein SADUNF_Sadunf07G0046500 [Salix dunnii]|uniref:Transmembrane protein n=1 Tax=Salix dunnii TaxID=1413687 RepID=A0A835K335_9ROSI|nr:hypothetical protein SADUNF_Sadunf07G0046500 [Salix dunnii]